MELVYLDERPLGEFLVDLGFVHDVLGSAGVLQRAQGLLRRWRGQVTNRCRTRAAREARRLFLSKQKTERTSRLLEEGDTVAMMEVFVRPPSESCRILVSLDSLWGEYTSFI